MTTRKYSILSLASEWFSYHGGVSTFNRSLCSALAAAGHKVHCLVPDASQEEIADAQASGVVLLGTLPIPGLSVHARLSLPLSLDSPDIVIGHAHITGPAASAQVACFYKSARRIHFIHTLPEELEWFKEERGIDAATRAEQKQDIEAQLAITSSLAVAVGPRLKRHWSNYLRAIKEEFIVHRFNPGLSDEFATKNLPPSIECLVSGRIEDYHIKGADIAAAALGAIAKGREFRGQNEPTLVVRGAKPQTSKVLREKLLECAKTGILIKIKEFTHNSAKVREDISRASIVLLPSRTEGFGLIGLEALSMGVPVLVSERSGLAELLSERVDADPSLKFASKYIVDVQGNMETDPQDWADAIAKILRNRELAFRETGLIRDALRQTDYWPRAVSELFNALDNTRDSLPVPGVKPDGEYVKSPNDKFAPATSVSISTNNLEQMIEQAVVLRGMAKSGLRPEYYLAILKAKGLATPTTVEQIKHLYHQRNLVVHSTTPSVDEKLAKAHASSVDSLISQLPPIIDELDHTVTSRVKTLIRFVKILDFQFEDYQRESLVLLVNELINRLQRTPKRTRQLLVSIVNRSTSAPILSGYSIALVSEIQAATGLAVDDLKNQVEILRKYKIAGLSSDNVGEIHLYCLDGPWDFWSDLILFCNETNTSLEEFVVNLQFELLD